jgi:hypothetical protein
VIRGHELQVGACYQGYVGVCVSACLCVHVSPWVRLRVCVCVSVCVCAHVVDICICVNMSSVDSATCRGPAMPPLLPLTWLVGRK